MNTLKFDFNNMMADFVGEKEGFSINDLENLCEKATSAFATVEANRGQGMQGWMNLPTCQTEIVKDINETAKNVIANYDYFVVLGIGGSALGPISVAQALTHLHYNDLPKSMRKTPKFYIEDNIDPERMKALFDVIDVEKTMFNVVTKSGSTSETMSQLLIITNLLKSRGLKLNEHLIATTDKAKGNLIKIAQQENLKMFVIPDGVGGRFSELCPVGLLPAAVLGIDIAKLLEGADQMDKICDSGDMWKNPALMSAVLLYIAMQQGKNMHVMMPYADSLKYVADWYAQLWAESLGKILDNQNKAIYSGQTPVKALGVTDQHSQIQLYTEGPFDKVLTFVTVENFRTTTDIPCGYENIPDVSFLGGHTLNELLSAEQKATEYALTKAQRLNNTITLSQVNENTVGQLLQFFMLQTAYAGALLGINAYNQPGVEEGKNATYALLGKKGYDAKKAELDSAKKKSKKFVL